MARGCSGAGEGSVIPDREAAIPSRDAAIHATVREWCGHNCSWPTCGCGPDKPLIDVMFAAGEAFARTALLPDDVPPGFERVRAVIRLEHDGGWQVRGASHWTQNHWGHYNSSCRTLGYITADVPLPAAPPEIVGRVET